MKPHSERTTMGRKSKSSKPAPTGAELQVSFKNASPTKKRRNLGVEMGRDELDLDAAVALLVNAQLDCTISCDPNDDEDDENQGKFDPDDVKELAFTADVGNLTITPDVYAFTLAVPLDLHADDVEKFRYRKGKLVATKTGQASIKDDADQPSLALANG